MKKYFLFSFAILSCLLANAQATDLVIDNQTPGWLSSKINYGDQMTVKNLKVTGYVNAEDLNFIGTLAMTKSLNGHLDLSDVSIVSNDGKSDGNWDWWKQPDGALRKLTLPNSLVSGNSIGKGFTIDTLVVNIKTIKKSLISRQGDQGTNTGTISRTLIKNIIFGDNVETIGSGAFEGACYHSAYESIVLPRTLKRIETSAFMNSILNMEKINIGDLPYLEEIGNMAFYNDQVTTTSVLPNNGGTLPDTINYPKIKEFYITAFGFQGKKCDIYLGKDIETINYSPDVRYTAYWHPNLSNICLHILRQVPPDFKSNYDITGLTLYVPKGSSSAYKQKFGNQYPNRWGNCTIIEEEAPLREIVLNKHDILIDVNESYRLSATLIPQNADNATIVWSSLNNDIASVSSNGLVTGHSSGETVVFAKSSDGAIKDSCNVVVKSHVTQLTLLPSIIRFTEIGQTQTLTPVFIPENSFDKSITWSSSDHSVCNVTDNGVVISTGYGTATILAIATDGMIPATCTVYVEKEDIQIVQVKLNKNEAIIDKGATLQLSASILPEDATNKELVWSSSDNRIVTVDNAGVVNAKNKGVAYVKVSSADGNAKDSCRITVRQPVNEVIVSPDVATINGIGRTIQLTAQVLPEDADDRSVTWTSSNEDVCMVSSRGNVVALALGTAKVYAISADGIHQGMSIVIVTNESDGISDSEAKHEVIKTSGGVEVYGMKGDNLLISDLHGVILYNKKNENEKTFVPLRSGIYIVHIGNFKRIITL